MVYIWNCVKVLQPPSKFLKPLYLFRPWHPVATVLPDRVPPFLDVNDGGHVISTSRKLGHILLDLGSVPVDL